MTYKIIAEIDPKDIKTLKEVVSKLNGKTENEFELSSNTMFVDMLIPEMYVIITGNELQDFCVKFTSENWTVIKSMTMVGRRE